MSNPAFFSIIIPTLNEDFYLPCLLIDLTNQTSKDFEVIVVDGHSDDQTVSKAKLFRSRLPTIKVVNSSKRNVSHQRNLGSKKASGKYLLFVDADSRLPLHFLERLTHQLNHSQTQLFTCWCAADSSALADKAVAIFLNQFTESEYQLGVPGALGAMIGCDRMAFDKTGGFNPAIASVEDGEFIRRCYKSGLQFSIFKNPKFVFSFRRIREYGKLRSILIHLRLRLKSYLKIEINQPLEYPMGGGFVWKRCNIPAHQLRNSASSNR
jgi:glycosyltransferase involved in cell wall biosynthesis